jgi:hypothetical protein
LRPLVADRRRAARRSSGAADAGVDLPQAPPVQNTGVPLSRISWLVTVGICLIAALLLLVNGYVGYSGVLLAVGAAAAVNVL